MRKLFTVIFSLLLITVISAGNGNDKKIKESKVTKGDGTVSNVSRAFDFFTEGWETGFGNWVHTDETSIAAQWHLDTWNAYGGSGESWFMADVTLGTNGGYNNSWYQVLDTDPIAISGANPNLTFYHRYAVEGPGGEPAGYNAWDGMNVRISTDGGTTWAVLANPTPAYTATSLYSFGFEHGEGEGIAGWAGALATWTQVTFDLSAFDGQSVNIRFAFGSDPGYSTADDGSLFAWQVDDILVANDAGTIFSNDGTAAGVTASNFAATGADLWNIATTGGAVGPNFATCNNGTNTYEPNMQNSLTSEYFTLYSAATQAWLDFQVRGTFSDNDVFPDVDYWGAYVQVEGEANRRYISNITQDPNGDNFVYSDAPAAWSPFSTTYSTGLIDLSSLIGERIRVIFEFESDGDTPIGTALEVDDLRVYTDENIVPVELTSFTAKQTGTSINLNWVTATETNNLGFEVQRQLVVDGQTQDWRMLSFKKGNGNSTSDVSYSYQDDITNVSAEAISYRLKQVDFDGSYTFTDVVEVSEVLPSEFSLKQNYPNPFNPSTKISYQIPSDNIVNLTIYNSLGEKVTTLVNELKTAGNYEINFDASNLSSGIYFYILSTNNFTATKKMMLLK